MKNAKLLNNSQLSKVQGGFEGANRTVVKTLLTLVFGPLGLGAAELMYKYRK